eukprot:622063-Hanusia_phi.AAC.1
MAHGVRRDRNLFAGTMELVQWLDASKVREFLWGYGTGSNHTGLHSVVPRQREVHGLLDFSSD